MESIENMGILLSYAFELLWKLCEVIYYKMSTTKSQKNSRIALICDKKLQKSRSLVHITKCSKPNS